MSRGWAFVARQIERERLCLVSSVQHSTSMLTLLLKTLKVMGIIQHVIVDLDDELYDGLHDSLWHSSEKLCFVFYSDNSNVQRIHELYTLYKNKYILLVVTRYLTSVPVVLLPLVPCMLWEMSYFISVPFVANYCPMIKRFMDDHRMALLYQGPIFCSSSFNLCCPLNLPGINERLFTFSIHELFTPSQRRFRKKRTSVMVIQRAVKEWLYRPEVCLGQKIVYRLNCCQK